MSDTPAELGAREQAALRVRGAGKPRVELPHYVGFATRVVAFVIDAAVINLVAALTAGGAALAVSIFDVQDSGFMDEVKQAAPWLAAAVFLVWSVAYFTGFWATTGQTPGDRVMGIVVLRDGERGTLHVVKALLRFWAMVLSAVPLGAGFLPILTDDRRRGLHDRIAGTVVVRAEPPPRRRAAPVR